MPYLGPLERALACISKTQIVLDGLRDLGQDKLRHSKVQEKLLPNEARFLVQEPKRALQVKFLCNEAHFLAQEPIRLPPRALTRNQKILFNVLVTQLHY